MTAVLNLRSEDPRFRHRCLPDDYPSEVPEPLLPMIIAFYTGKPVPKFAYREFWLWYKESPTAHREVRKWLRHGYDVPTFIHGGLSRVERLEIISQLVPPERQRKIKHRIAKEVLMSVTANNTSSLKHAAPGAAAAIKTAEALHGEFFRNQKIGSFEICFMENGKPIQPNHSDGYLALKPRGHERITRHFVLKFADGSLPPVKELLREINAFYSRSSDYKVAQIHCNLKQARSP
jgi:hypothetical protein